MEKTAAVVTIFEGNQMSKKGRKMIADFLRKQADDFERYGHVYAKRFTHRYRYQESETKKRKRGAKVEVRGRRVTASR